MNWVWCDWSTKGSSPFPQGNLRKKGKYRSPSILDARLRNFNFITKSIREPRKVFVQSDSCHWLMIVWSEGNLKSEKLVFRALLWKVVGREERRGKLVEAAIVKSSKVECSVCKHRWWRRSWSLFIYHYFITLHWNKTGLDSSVYLELKPCTFLPGLSLCVTFSLATPCDSLLCTLLCWKSNLP